jgi:hypothetical protein
MTDDAPVHTISGSTIIMDDGGYKRIHFVDCDLIYRGGKPPQITGCRFSNCRWRFEQQAANTLGFLQAMAADPGMRDFVEVSVMGPKVDE